MPRDEQKRRALQLRAVDDSWNIEGGLILSRGDQRCPFDESHDGQLFWRGDSRGPKEVFKTGFSANAYRINPPPGYTGKVIWRCSDDDIYHDSGVSLARDIRGAAFFPFTDGTEDDDPFSFFLYAVAPAWTANTYRAQQIAEAVETGEMRGSFAPPGEPWRKHEDRWRYDPGEDDHGDASCVWQFQEHVTLEVEPKDIIGGWRACRRMLVSKGTASRERAGIRFYVEKKGAARGPVVEDDAFAQAKAIVDDYDQWYPKRYNRWLSFQGIVEGTIGMADFAEAKQKAKQLQAIVVESKKRNDREDW